MFDNRPRLSNSNHHLLQQGSLSTLKDSISSITYRITQIQTALNRKMDRSQCLGIIDKKVSMGQLKNYLDELQNKIKEQHKEQQDRISKMQQIAIHKINELSHKLTNKKNKAHKQRIIKPQQLFLESNQTMFSLLIDQVSKLQQKDIEFQRQLQNRNKRIINLNNQVCKKIEKIQNQVEEKQSTNNTRFRTKVLGQPTQVKYFGNSWSSQMDRNNKPTVHKTSQMEGSTFQSLRFDIISKSIQTLQKDMLSKINIKDVLPIIRQNTQSFDDSIQQLKDYVEQSMESTRKILLSQTEINGELSLALKIGWWHSFDQQNQIAIINKQLINLVPEIFQLSSGNQSAFNFINVTHQGLYLIKIFSLFNIPNFADHSTISNNQQQEFEVMIGSEVHILGKETLLRLQKNSQIRIIVRNHAQFILYIQKI